MAPRVKVRELTVEETEEIKRLVHSRKDAVRKVERAKVVWLSHQGKTVTAIASELGVHPNMVRARLKRFNEQGLAGLEDAQRSGRPAVYTAEQTGQVVAAALTSPKELELPFAAWTLDRLEAYLNEQKGIGIKRSRIDEILLHEGLRWRKDETWFGERVDPEFAEKRGASPSSTRSHQQTA